MSRVQVKYLDLAQTCCMPYNAAARSRYFLCTQVSREGCAQARKLAIYMHGCLSGTYLQTAEMGKH